jgi:hypothetical protein
VQDFRLSDGFSTFVQQECQPLSDSKQKTTKWTEDYISNLHFHAFLFEIKLQRIFLGGKFRKSKRWNEVEHIGAMGNLHRKQLKFQRKWSNTRGGGEGGQQCYGYERNENPREREEILT